MLCCDIMSYMKVKVISPTVQEFNGERYYLCGRYFQNGKHRLHRMVWKYHYGEIPKGLLIDHIDRNRANNQIENLRLTTYKVNCRNVSDEVKQKRKEHMDNIRELTKEWHASKEGREWHKKVGIESWANPKATERECRHCHKKFYSRANGKSYYCCNNCKQRARTRRLKGLPEDYVF